MPGSPGAAEPQACPPTFSTALAFWLKLGWVSFGGPAGQIALMHQELVERRRWISPGRFDHALNYCMLLPGPEAQQLATYIGWSLHGVRGGLAAGLLFILPALLILIALSWLYATQGQQPAVTAVLDAVKPAVVAVVAAAAWRMGRRSLGHPLLWCIAGSALVALAILRIPFALVVIGAALVGALANERWPRAFVLGVAHGSGSSGPGGSAQPPAAGPALWRSTVLALAAFLLLWLVSFGALVLGLGWDATLTRMGWFFTQAALMTFGGAYAVLPFVFEGAVNGHGWLTAGQMMDGLALGETTPGPLIMVVAYVGFLGAWGQALFGPEHRLWAGVAAALLVTWFTFLPSFAFILAGGPWVERLQGRSRWNAPLMAITAAVVGVILSLALEFGRQALWPPGLHGAMDLRAAAIGLAAGWLMIGRGWAAMPVLGLAALIGAAQALVSVAGLGV